MEQAMQELTDTVVTFVLYGVLFLAALTAFKLIFYRSVLGKILGSGRKSRRKKYGRKAGGEGIVSATEFVYNQYKELEKRKKNEKIWAEKQDPVVGLGGGQGKKDRNYSEDLMDRGDAYISRSHLMTPTERDVFKVLEKAYGDKYHIFCQVRVVDVIQPNVKKYHNESKEFLSLFRQLSQWHFDYVLCDRETFKIFCALELDDITHNRPERVKRDRIINRACKESGVRLERMRVNHDEKKIELSN